MFITKNINQILLFIVIILLSGCLAKTSTSSFSGPTGKSLFKTKCNVDTSKCFAEASSKCRGSYNVIDSESHAGGTLADIIPGPVTWYSMTYECGPSNGKYPSFAFQGQRFSPPSFLYNPSNSGSSSTELNNLKRGLTMDCIQRGGVFAGNRCLNPRR